MKSHFTIASLIAISTIFATSEPQEETHLIASRSEGRDYVHRDGSEVDQKYKHTKRKDKDRDLMERKRRQNVDGGDRKRYDLDWKNTDKRREDKDIRGERDYDSRH